MGGNICKQCDQEGLNFQNIQTALSTTKKANNPTAKWKGDLNRYFLKKTVFSKDGQ